MKYASKYPVFFMIMTIASVVYARQKPLGNFDLISQDIFNIQERDRLQAENARLRAELAERAGSQSQQEALRRPWWSSWSAFSARANVFFNRYFRRQQ